jgi:hypothetical protein
MSELAGSLVVASLAFSPTLDFAPPPVIEHNWCTPGHTVMVPDGREAWVSSVDGDICRIIAEGEAYVTLIPFYIVERVYPQPFIGQAIGH